MHLLGDPHVGGDPAHDRVLRDVRRVIGSEQHLNARRDEECGEDVEHPIGFGDESRAAGDHQSAQHDHCQDAPQQGAILIFRRNGEEGEDHRDDEDVVDRQRLFDKEPGEVFGARSRALLEPHPDAKCQRDGNVEGRKLQRFADAHLPVFLVQKAQVEGRQRNDQHTECQPEPDWRAQPVMREKFHHRLPL